MITAANYYTHQGEFILVVPFVLLVVWAVLDYRKKNRGGQ